jgi:4-amino-4-deoxy-L-arabinose transferase-like glycosyltransferase
MAAWIALVGYSSRDPDSRLYAQLSAQLAAEPAARWIAPDWAGLWGWRGPYQEHPIGLFVVPALFARAGYPTLQAAYAVNGLFQILSFVLIGLIANAVIPRRDARALSWILQLLPIAFVFRVRANQEYALLLGLLFAVYATERTRTRGRWALGMLAGFAWVLFVKGLFAFMVPLVSMVWLLALADSRADLARQRAAWLAVALMPIVAIGLALEYEHAYVSVTGTSFLAAYRARQIPDGAITGGSPFTRTLYTLSWYTGRVIWFAFPWSVVAGAAIVSAWRRQSYRALWPWDAGDTDSARDRRSRAHQGTWFALVAATVLVAAFSIAHRKADRYIFPAYFLVGAAGAGAGLGRYAWLARLAERFDRPWVPAAVWFGLFVLRMLTLGKLPEFTFWRS